MTVAARHCLFEESGTYRAASYCDLLLAIVPNVPPMCRAPRIAMGMPLDLGLVNYLPPPTEALVRYAAALYSRLRSAVVVRRHLIEINGWRPEPNDCHTNASTVAAVDPRVKAVRGWLLFDFERAFAYVRFTAHSVIELDDGELIDITPPPPHNPYAGVYPFVRAELPEEEFQAASDALIRVHGAAHLDHVYR